MILAGVSVILLWRRSNKSAVWMVMTGVVSVIIWLVRTRVSMITHNGFLPRLTVVGILMVVPHIRTSSLIDNGYLARMRVVLLLWLLVVLLLLLLVMLLLWLLVMMLLWLVMLLLSMMTPNLMRTALLLLYFHKPSLFFFLGLHLQILRLPHLIHISSHGRT